MGVPGPSGPAGTIGQSGPSGPPGPSGPVGTASLSEWTGLTTRIFGEDYRLIAFAGGRQIVVWDDEGTPYISLFGAADQDARALNTAMRTNPYQVTMGFSGYCFYTDPTCGGDCWIGNVNVPISTALYANGKWWKLPAGSAPEPPGSYFKSYYNVRDGSSGCMPYNSAALDDGQSAFRAAEFTPLPQPPQ